MYRVCRVMKIYSYREELVSKTSQFKQIPASFVTNVNEGTIKTVWPDLFN